MNDFVSVLADTVLTDDQEDVRSPDTDVEESQIAAAVQMEIDDEHQDVLRAERDASVDHAAETQPANHQQLHDADRHVIRRDQVPHATSERSTQNDWHAIDHIPVMSCVLSSFAHLDLVSAMHSQSWTWT